LASALGFKTGPSLPAIIADYPCKYTDTSPLNFDARISSGAGFDVHLAKMTE